MKNLISFILLVTIVTTSCNNNATTEKKEVKIGTQTWMTENLNVDKFQNGDPIPEVKSQVDWKKAAENMQPAWCYYDNKASNGEKYGKLYNWYAVNDPRGLAPKGWRIPTKDDWLILSDFLGYESVSGGKLKSSKGWSTYPEDYEGYDEYQGTNESGFNGLPGGYRTTVGFQDIFENAEWWASSVSESGCVQNIKIINGRPSNELFFKQQISSTNRAGKTYGLSVRCVKN
jgi:uncharacterized protein (TIGR02145 family)